jgi:hypothetical protein
MDEVERVCGMRRKKQAVVPREVHILNLGAGVQSTWLYLAFINGWLGLPKLDCAIWADTGDEPGAEARELGLPDTEGSVYAHLDWLRSLGGPPILSGNNGVISHDLSVGKNSTGDRFVSIPAFTTDGKKKGKAKRQCTKEYKLEVIGRVMRREFLGLPKGRSPVGIIVHQYLGLSFDEGGRVARNMRAPRPKYIKMHFPLWENFITRANCETDLVARVPHKTPRSACVECPFHTDDEWLKIKSVPLDWARAVRIDESLRTSGSVANRKMDQTMYLHRSCQPLVQIEFKPSDNALAKQSTINFAAECLGMCGL